MSTGVDMHHPGLLDEVLIARQPILDRGLTVVGHELLYWDASGAGPLDAGIRETAAILIDGVIGLGRGLLANGERVATELIRELFRAGIDVVDEKVEEPAAFDRMIGAGAALVRGFFSPGPVWWAASGPLRSRR